MRLITGLFSLLWALGVFLSSAIHVSASAASSVAISPSADGTVTKDLSSGTYSVSTTGPDIYSELLPSADLRGISEFPIGSIPVGSLVNAATLSLDVVFYGNGTGVDGVTGTFQLCGFRGDGAITSGDWNQDGVALQNFSLTVGNFGTIALDVKPFVQDLVSSGYPNSGFLIKGFTPYLEVGFNIHPVLDVQFTPVPEPSIVALLIVAGGVIVSKHRFPILRWLSHRF